MREEGIMKKTFKLSLISIMAASVYSVSLSAQEWTYQLEPYLMVTSIEGNASIGRATGVDVDVDFGTILDNLESAAMVHLEAHHNSGWGVALDYGYMDLGSKKSNENDSSANAEVRQGVLELLALYRNKLANGYVDYFAGIRWWDNNIGLSITTSALPGDGFIREVKSDWVDPVVGIRWMRNINQDWTFIAQADVGGFGIESDFTSSVQTGVQYKISDLMVLNVKYKATWVDFEEGGKGGSEYFQYNTVTHGSVIGLIFNF
jgi:hypothetical protein